MNAFCQIQWLDQIEYGQALELQKELVTKRAANEIPDTLLLMEHPSTYTLGVDGHRDHLLISDEQMARLNIAYHEVVDRGGSIIYYSPGQLVVYPILKLGKPCYNYHEYIKMLESVIIRTLSFFKVRAFRQQGQRGVWVFSGNLATQSSSQRNFDSSVAKISAIGVKVDPNNITSHGFSINVNPRLEYFDFIVPSGVKDCQVTSLRHVLNKPIEISTVIEPVIQSFCEIFEMKPLLLETPITDQNFVWSTL